MMQSLWKAEWRPLKKPRTVLPSVLPGLLPKNKETLIQKDIRTPTFIAALFTMAKI